MTKHKWAHPFKRPVTDKEAPDYKDIIKNPMDLSTLRKRVESGAVAEVAALVDGLILIFENAMQYNPKSSDCAPPRPPCCAASDRASKLARSRGR